MGGGSVCLYSVFEMFATARDDVIKALLSITTPRVVLYCRQAGGLGPGRGLLGRLFESRHGAWM